MNTPPCTSPVAPGLIVTVGNQRRVEEEFPALLPVLRAIGPDGLIVMLHTYPDPPDVATAAMLRRELPGVRVWLQSPANVLAGLPLDRAEEAVRRWVDVAIAAGAEVLSLNGEGASAPGRPGWAAKALPARAALGERVKALLAAAHDQAEGRVALAWSSHDCVDWHYLPWAALLGEGSPVALHLPQVYPVPPRGRATRHGALARYATAHAQQARAAHGIRPDLRLGVEGCAPITQAHDLTTAAACALLDKAPLSGVWTLPDRADAAGLLALRADAELRRRAGHAPGRIARFQGQAGLFVDGDVGPGTLRALGLAS
jgi:hypothetical protein